MPNLLRLPPPYKQAHVDGECDRPTTYSERQIQAYGQACREQALLDAMNATRAFGKTGEVIAVMIGALK